MLPFFFFKLALVLNTKQELKRNRGLKVAVLIGSHLEGIPVVRMALKDILNIKQVLTVELTGVSLFS